MCQMTSSSRSWLFALVAGVLSSEADRAAYYLSSAGNSKIKSVTLTSVQSIPAFAKDGDIKIHLAPDLDPAADLKFDASSEYGVGNQIKTLHALGSGTFKKVKTGETQKFELKLDDATRDRIAKQGKLCLVITPAERAVAATFFGAGDSERGNRPRLAIELP
jgi:hypothetical protein